MFKTNLHVFIQYQVIIVMMYPSLNNNLLILETHNVCSCTKIIYKCLFLLIYDFNTSSLSMQKQFLKYGRLIILLYSNEETNVL